MARNNGQLPGESAASSRTRSVRDAADDDAPEFASPDLESPLDLDSDEQSPFLRAQKRVQVRRGPLARKTANRLKQGLVVLGVLCVAGIATLTLYRYGSRSWRFRIESSDNIEIVGISKVARSQVMAVLGGDIGRNIFFVPLAERKKQLEEISWVETATVMRFLPDRIRVEVRERTPVAFVLVRSRIALIDSQGVVMEMPANAQSRYSFPVIRGMGDSDPLSTRAARMRIYGTLVRELDSGGGRYSQDLSEVDLSDPEDVKITVASPSGQVLVHLGSSNFLDRYKIYVTNVQKWRQDVQQLESVDLRYLPQVIVNPDLAHALGNGGRDAPAAAKPPAPRPRPRAWKRPARSPTPGKTATAPR